MTASAAVARQKHQFVRLPDIDQERTPGWRFTRHAVLWTLTVFLVVLAAGLIGASRVSVRITVSADGVVEPPAVWSASSTESGVVAAILVATGDTVVTGQVVATLLSLPRARPARVSIRAPGAGVVLTDRPEQLLGMQVRAGQPLLEIADLRHWRAILSVGERDAYRIRPGDAADITIPAVTASGSNRFAGRVKSIGLQPANTAAVSLDGSAARYRVIVEIDTTALRLTVASLRRGYAARGAIVTRSERGIALVAEYLRSRTRSIAP